MSDQNFRTDPRIIEFINTAESFCNNLDVMPNGWMFRVIEILPKLYSAAQSLPRANEYQVSSSTNNDVLKFRMTHGEWSSLLQKVGAAIGESRFYWEIFDPIEYPPAEPVCGDIADDLADIYRDLKAGLGAWNNGSDALIPDILFEVREVSFRSHWGPHLLSAIRPIHRLLHEKEGDCWGLSAASRPASHE